MGKFTFHLGIIPVFFGHVVGLLIPANWLEAIEVNNHIYHIGAVYIGSVFWYNNINRNVVANFKTTIHQKR